MRLNRRGLLRRMGIRGRVLWLALAPLALVIVVLTAYMAWSRVRDLDRALMSRGAEIARHLAPASEYGVFAGNRAFLERLAAGAHDAPDVVAIVIRDRDGVMLARSGLPADRYPPGLIQEFRARILQTPVDTEDLPPASLLTPDAGAAAEVVGEVVVMLSREPTTALQRRMVLESLVIGVTGLLLATLLALRMAGGVITPVRRLTAAVRDIEAGRPHTPLPALAGGEIGQLERSVNAMAIALEQAHARERAHTEDRVYHERLRAETTLESIADGVITTDGDGRVVYMNPVAEQFTGWTRAEADGKSLGVILHVLDERSGMEWEYPLHLCLESGRTIHHDSHHMLVRRDGHLFAVQDAAAPIRDRSGHVTGAVVAIHDITEVRHMASRMSYLASHDSLTGLVNRREFEALLAQAIESAHDQDVTHALAYLDLDQFKIVNDTCGHLAGDELLKQLAQRLSLDVRHQDVLARLGGDEFGVILYNCPIERARDLAEVLRASVRDFRFVWNERLFEIGVSAGVVAINQQSGSLAEVMNAADSACYVAKDRGRNNVYVYHPADSALAQRQSEVEWAQRVRSAIAEGHFRLYAQRILALRDDAAGAARPRAFFEILVRMDDGAGGLSMPAMFIPAAERYHLMPVLDRHVVAMAFDALAGHIAELAGAAHPAGARFAINLSGQSLNDPGLLTFVMDRFAATGIAPHAICFEITETAAIANIVRANRFIAVLKGMGCTFALDDFGSGLSSFSYLKSLPVDYLKIAGNFVQDVEHDALDFAMVEAINDIGHILGLITIAESVESPAIAAKLRASGIDFGQGLGIEHPRALEEVLRELGDEKSSGRQGST